MFDTAWLVPFTFIPAVGMLILSTSNRFHHVNQLIRSLSGKKTKRDQQDVCTLIRRSKYFHNALMFLYFAVAFFALSALIGNLHQNWFDRMTVYRLISDLLILSGVSCFIGASYQLIRESILSFKMIRDHIPGSD